jgi:Flp pilus assembly protein TadG
MKSTIKTIRKPWQRGNALIEMGLATPMLMLLLSAVIDFGRVFYYSDAAVSAARAGAQYGIQSAANFGNHAGMQLAAETDAQDIPNFSATATSYCQDSNGTAVACTAAGAEGYVKVATSITYDLILSWPGIPNPLPVGAKAIMRRQ